MRVLGLLLGSLLLSLLSTHAIAADGPSTPPGAIINGVFGNRFWMAPLKPSGVRMVDFLHALDGIKAGASQFARSNCPDAVCRDIRENPFVEPGDALVAWLNTGPLAIPLTGTGSIAAAFSAAGGVVSQNGQALQLVLPTIGQIVGGAPYSGALTDRSMASRLADFVNVTDFVGADPTGATDSLGAIQLGLATSMNVRIPPGHWRITQSWIDMTVPGQRLYCDGPATTITVVRGAVNPAPALIIEPSATDAVFEGCTVDHQGTQFLDTGPYLLPGTGLSALNTTRGTHTNDGLGNAVLVMADRARFSGTVLNGWDNCIGLGLFSLVTGAQSVGPFSPFATNTTTRGCGVGNHNNGATDFQQGAGIDVLTAISAKLSDDVDWFSYDGFWVDTSGGGSMQGSNLTSYFARFTSPLFSRGDPWHGYDGGNDSGIAFYLSGSDRNFDGSVGTNLLPTSCVNCTAVSPAAQGLVIDLRSDGVTTSDFHVIRPGMECLWAKGGRHVMHNFRCDQPNFLKGIVPYAGATPVPQTSAIQVDANATAGVASLFQNTHVQFTGSLSVSGSTPAPYAYAVALGSYGGKLPTVTAASTDLMAGALATTFVASGATYLDQGLKLVVNSAAARGALCGGGDDTAALLAWAAAVTANSNATLPPGTCRFSSPLVFPVVDHVSLRGTGTVMLYTGTSTTPSLVTIGTSVNNTPTTGDGCSVRDWTIEGLSIKSATTMTAGDGLQINDGCSVDIRNVNAGRDLNGDGKLWNGVHLNGGNTVHFRGGGASAQNDALLINGDPYLQFTDAFVEGTFLGSATGIHAAGKVGGLNLDHLDALENHVNLLIDQAQVASANEQIMIGGNAAFDLTNGAPNRGIYINDPGGSQSLMFLTGAWVASALDSGIYVTAGDAWQIAITGGAIFNNQASGIYNGSAAASVNIVGTRVGQNGAYGLNNPTGTMAKCGVVFSPPNNGGSGNPQTFGTIGSSC